MARPSNASGTATTPSQLARPVPPNRMEPANSARRREMPFARTRRDLYTQGDRAMTAGHETASTPDAPASGRRWWRILLAAGLLLCGGLVLTYYLLRQAADRELAGVLADLDERDP